jgi:hypothetical protein
VEASDLGTEKSPDKKDEEEHSRTWLDLLQRIGGTVAPAILTAGGFVGFLAFAGSIIVWTRFQAAEVPPDQAVAAYPRGELVAVASALLLIFGFVGVLAVLILFLVNPKGEASIGVSRALLGLLAVEGLAAIFLVDRPWDQDKVLALELFMLPLFVALWATFLYERENLGAESDGGKSGSLPLVGDTFQDILPDYLLRSAFVNRTILAVSLTIIVSLVLALWISLEWVAIGALAVICAGPTAWLIWKLAVSERPKTRTLDRGEIPFERQGQVLIGVLLLLGAIVPSVLLSSRWLPFSLFAAVALIAAVWRVAVIADSFMWFGLAVFISVPLFGTITGIVRNVADPQVQPVALIRKDDGPDEAIQGIYVTETDDRVYFATVATEGCTDELVPNSGRLLWVPKSDVVAISIGPPQSVDDAAKTALEMSYALTPAVETPAGDHISLTVAEKRGKEQEATEGSQERRLEDVGPAVQPNFGRGLRLSPENASPGDVVTLKMAAPNPNEEVQGFGSSRDGRTVRLGGVPVDILKEQVRDPLEAEYVETEDGRPMTLEKDTLYVRDDGDYVETENPNLAKETGFVRLIDEGAKEANDHGPYGDNFLPLESTEDGTPVLAATEGRAPAVVLEDVPKAVLDPHLWRQAWHESQIRFRVPEHATTGAVTVECEQLAGQPLLRVERPPQAKISVRIEPGSRRVVFDSGRSTDNSRIVSRQWFIEGVDRGRAARISESLPPRSQSYLVKLKVTDAEGQTGNAELHLLRLNGSVVSSRKSRNRKTFAEAKTELRRAIAAAPATSVEFEMRPGELPTTANPNKTFESAKKVRMDLLGEAEAARAGRAQRQGTVKTLAFGAACPAERESEVGRLDVLVLGPGVRVVPPNQCPVVRYSVGQLPP